MTTAAPTKAAAVSWSTPREASRLLVCRRALRTTLPVAMVVGTVLSAVNQAGIIAAGQASGATWARVGANYLVPFCVSSFGFLSACRDRPAG